MYVIVEKTDVGGRDTIYAHILATESVYGGAFLPSFSDKNEAVGYLKCREDSYRKFLIKEIKER